MINVGIIGASTPLAGELLRILVNHPDVTIRSVVDKSLAGCDITSAHHGLIGESSLEFSSELDTKKLDVVFVASNRGSCEKPDLTGYPDLCLIELTGDFAESRRQDALCVYGVPELNRKALVRGARHAVVPSPLESVATVALLPLAMRSMLPEQLELTVEAEPAILETQPLRLRSMIQELVATGVNDFNINTTFKPVELNRVIRISCDISLPVPIDNITDMYEELYDDHNLTFIVGEAVEPAEVEGTDKLIISLDKGADGTLQLRAIADARMRGGAGDAVHVMNLLMGLYEKTGLAIKASRF